MERHSGVRPMTTVYIDRVFLLNFLADYLLLLTASRLAGIPLRRLRLALCALLGAAYAVAVFLPGGAILAWPVWRLSVGVGMAVLAFWPQPRRLRLTALFLLLSGALAGVLLALGLAVGAPEAYLGRTLRAEISWPVFAGAAAAFYLLLTLLFRRSLRHGGGEIMRVTVTIGEKKRTLLALHDTGNTLCDPVSGEAVLVLEQSAIYDLWPPEVSGILDQLLPPEEKMVQLHRLQLGRAFSLLPYRSVGVPSGLLLAYRSDGITVEGRTHRRTLLALSEGPLSDGGTYQALWGGEERRKYDGHMARHAAVAPPEDQAV
ncbi:MAG: sigma-E processing peptidase SpoIIGA [Ruminococcaceae bacterium]|nr:sigma-E processing peptidase SpoIIGA [Oscillospiraceae bacterium]